MLSGLLALFAMAAAATLAWKLHPLSLSERDRWATSPIRRFMRRLFSACLWAIVSGFIISAATAPQTETRAVSYGAGR